MLSFDEVFNSLPNEWINYAGGLINELGFSGVDELVKNYPRVRDSFIKLVDEGFIDSYLRENYPNIHFDNLSKLIDLMRLMPVVDDGVKSQVYSLLIIAQESIAGSLEIFYSINSEGVRDSVLSNQLFHPLRRPFGKKSYDEIINEDLSVLGDFFKSLI